MSYKITITQVIDNPDFNEDALKEYQKSRGYGYGNEKWDERIMAKKRDVEALAAQLTDDQFNALRDAALKVV